MSDQEHGAGLRAWREWSDSLGSDGWEDRVAPFDTCPWRLIEASLEREAQIPALIAAALEQAALKNEVCRVCGDLTHSEPLPFCERIDPDHMDDDDASYPNIATAIRALTPADARAAHDAMLAKAREEGRIEVAATPALTSKRGG